MELVVGCHNAAELAKVQQFLRYDLPLPVSITASQTAYRLVESYYLSHGLLIPHRAVGARDRACHR